MDNHDEDATPWIGYADFLFTLAILFLVVSLAVVVGLSPGPAVLIGTVRQESGTPDCRVRLGEGSATTTDDSGVYLFQLDWLSRSIETSLQLECDAHDLVDTVATLIPRDTVVLNIDLDEATRGNLSVGSLPGNVLFDRDSAKLSQKGMRIIRDSVASWRRKGLFPERENELLAVVGHTDILPFDRDVPIDNWMLSAQRAATVVRYLTRELNVGQCSVVAMGLGPSRKADGERSLADQRRIEFKKIQGSEILVGACRDRN